VCTSRTAEERQPLIIGGQQSRVAYVVGKPPGRLCRWGRLGRRLRRRRRRRRRGGGSVAGYGSGTGSDTKRRQKRAEEQEV